MDKSCLEPQSLHLEQLEPRYLLSGIPLLQNPAHSGDPGSQNRFSSSAYSSTNQPLKDASVFDQRIERHAVDRDDQFDDDDDDDDHGVDRDNIQVATASVQYPAESSLALARILISGNPVVAGEEYVSLASAKPDVFGRIPTQPSPALVDMALELLTRAGSSRFDSSSTVPDMHIAAPPERSAALPGALTPSELPSIVPLARAVAPVSGAESTATRLVDALGHLSIVDAGALEKSIRQFLDHVQDATRVSFGEDSDDGIVLWIAAAAAATLACEIGRRQMCRAAWGAYPENNLNGARDVLFSSLDSRI